LPEDERKALSGDGTFLLRERELSAPMRVNKPAIIGVQFMGDLFHENVPDEFIHDAYEIMGLVERHTFLVLTKRPERALKVLQQHDDNQWSNVWLGVTAENQEQADKRIPILLSIPAAHRFVSVEPMLGPVDLEEWLSPLGAETCHYGEVHRNGECDCRQSVLSCVVLGGETGLGARPMRPDWARSVRDQCQSAGVPFFFKGWGRHLPSLKDRIGEARPHYALLDVFTRSLDGREHNDLPWRVCS
jgi:protein gp37